MLLLSIVSLLPTPSSAAVESVSDLLSQYAARSFSVPSHRDISALHVLDAYVVYEGAVDGSGSHHPQPLAHFHPMSHHQFRTLDTESGLPSYAHRPSETAKMGDAGTYQPFPQSVVLSFEAFSQSFHLPLRRVESLFVPNATISVRDGWDAELSADAPLDSTYWALDGDYLDDNWAVATLREDGRFHAVINHEGEVYQADPIEHFRRDMDEQHFHTLATSSHRGMAIYRHSDVINQQDKQCGTDTGPACGHSREEQAATTSWWR